MTQIWMESKKRGRWSPNPKKRYLGNEETQEAGLEREDTERDHLLLQERGEIRGITQRENRQEIVQERGEEMTREEDIITDTAQSLDLGLDLDQHQEIER